MVESHAHSYACIPYNQRIARYRYVVTARATGVSCVQMVIALKIACLQGNEIDAHVMWEARGYFGCYGSQQRYVWKSLIGLLLLINHRQETVISVFAQALIIVKVTAHVFSLATGLVNTAAKPLSLHTAVQPLEVFTRSSTG